MVHPTGELPLSSTGSLRDGFRESVPLLLTSVALFVAGGVAGALRVEVGPGGFPLVGILVALGFVAAIGSVLSWFFAGDPARVLVAEATVTGPRGRTDGQRAGGHPPPRVRTDPTPPVKRAAVEPPPWDEGPIPEPAFRRPREVPSVDDIEVQLRKTVASTPRRNALPADGNLAPAPKAPAPSTAPARPRKDGPEVKASLPSSVSIEEDRPSFDDSDAQLTIRELDGILRELTSRRVRSPKDQP